MKQYLDLLNKVLEEGIEREDRTGVGTLSLFGYQFRCNLQDGFPLLTTKRVFMKGIVHELLWFLSGSTNVNQLKKDNVHIWDEWADEDGDLGPIYGRQWIHWANGSADGINQIKGVIRDIQQKPYSRRLVVSAWNVSDLDDMALPPCHALFQFYVANGRLSCQLYQRSADVFLGVPFNIASYALLTHMVAQVTGLEVGEFVHTFGDAHLYKNHLAEATEQLTREPRTLPQLKLDEEVHDIFDFRFDHIDIVDYHPHPKLPAPIAV